MSSDHQVRQELIGQSEQKNQRELNPSLGDFNLLVLLVRFPEDANAELPTQQYFADLCNNEIRPYFSKQSYGKYNINECVVMDWITTDNSAAFYAGGVSNLAPANVASKFFLPVLNAIDQQGMDWTQFDVDLDLNIDALLVLHSGYSAEQGKLDLFM
jgi:M6 family metalloprotease-like protein